MKKTKLTACIMACALMFGSTVGIAESFTGISSSSTITVEAATTFPVMKVKSASNVRRDPTSGNTVFAAIPSGAYVSKLAQTKYAGETWYYVKYNDIKGYVPAKNLTKVSVTVKKVKTKSDPLYLREKANTSSKIITSMPKGETVNVISSSKNGWSYVVYNGYTGYASTTYLGY